MDSRLPKEIIPKVSKRQLLIATLVPVVIIATVNAVFYWFPLNRAYLTSIYKWKLLKQLEAPIDWLIVGDSSGDLGVDPQQLQSSFGGEAVNLCTYGGLLSVDDVWMLDYFLQKKGQVNNVLMIHAYDIWQKDLPTEVIAANPITDIIWNGLQPSLEFSFEEYLSLFVGKYLPLFAQNESLKKAFIEPERIQFDTKRPMLANGFSPYRGGADSSNVYRDAKEHLAFLSEHQFSMSDINRRSLVAIKELAEKYHVQVYIANGPLFKQVAEDPRFVRYYQELRASLQQLCNSSDYLHFITNEPITFPVSLMQNADHVIEEGSKAYTQTLTERIKEAKKQY